MASTSQKRAWWANYRCDSQKMTRVTFPGEGRTWSLLVAAESAPAWELFASLMRKHGVTFRESAGGTYNCRHVNHNPNLGYSLHAYGIALDINPSRNPAGDPDKLRDPQHEFPQGFIDEVLASGLFRWGWDWDEDGSSDDHSFIDPMHWEIDVPPSEIGDDMAHKHEPPREDLPRGWADGVWEQWVVASGTDGDTRTQDFYREDLSWVYARVIEPLERKVAALEAKVETLQSGSGVPRDEYEGHRHGEGKTGTPL